MFTVLHVGKLIFKIKSEYLWLYTYTLFLSFEYVLVIYFIKINHYKLDWLKTTAVILLFPLVFVGQELREGSSKQFWLGASHELRVFCLGLSGVLQRLF